MIQQLIAMWKPKKAFIWKWSFHFLGLWSTVRLTFQVVSSFTDESISKFYHSHEGKILVATKESAHMCSKEWRNRWLTSEGWDGESQVWELIHLPFRQDCPWQTLEGRRNVMDVHQFHPRLTHPWYVLIHLFLISSWIFRERQGPLSSYKSDIFLKSSDSWFLSDGSFLC